MVYHVIYGICSDVIITVNPRQNLVWSLWSLVYVGINGQDRFIVILICRWSLLKDRKNFIVTPSTESSNNLCDIDRDIQYKTIRREQTAAPFFQFFILKKKVLTEKNQKGTYQGHIKSNRFSGEQLYKREQFREQFREQSKEHFCSRTSHRLPKEKFSWNHRNGAFIFP